VIVKAEADETRKEYGEVMRAFLREGRVPGFRPGKVPREIIKREFHKQITEEVQGRLFRALYSLPWSRRRQNGGAARCQRHALLARDGITFTLTVDTEPEFDLPKYKKIPVSFDEPAVTEEQVDEQIDRLRKALPSLRRRPLSTRSGRRSGQHRFRGPRGRAAGPYAG
jgi:trigger factor